MNDEQLGTLMVELNKTKDPEEAARKWIKNNQALVDEWVRIKKARELTYPLAFFILFFVTTSSTIPYTFASSAVIK